jgi:hypothetical protein
MWQCVTTQAVTDILKNCSAFILRVKQSWSIPPTKQHHIQDEKIFGLTIMRTSNLTAKFNLIIN